MAAKRLKAEIIRDKWGVANVYGDTEEDAFYGAGYATAEDRMFQMMVRRRLANGRIAEILGPGENGRHIEMDKRARLYGGLRRAEEALPRLDEENRSLIEAYADGVNRYLADHKGKLSPLFAKYGGDPEPWTPADGIAIWDFLSERFMFGWQGELEGKRKWEAADEAERRRMEAEIPPIMDDSAQIVPPEEFERSYPDVFKRLHAARKAHAQHLESLGIRPDHVKFSQNWAATRSRTTTGGALLESDPQYGVTNPSFWYEIHIIGGRYNARGIGIAGSPGMLIGWNDHCAWGATGLGGDDADLFEEKVNPDNPDQYLWKGEWREFAKRTETIHVKGQDPVTMEVLSTGHGPVFNEVLKGVRDDEVFALQSTLWAAGPCPLEAVLKTMRCVDWDSFRDAMRTYVAPPLHYLYADIHGNLGYQAGTTTPKRHAAGVIPRKGWTGEDEWEFVPFEELPSMLNPKSDWITTANNLAAGSWYPYRIGAGLGDGPRPWRLREIFSQDEHKYNVRDFITKVHRDTLNPAVRDFTALALKIIEEDGAGSEDVANAAKVLSDWDFRFDIASPAFAVGRGVLDEMQRRFLDGSGLQPKYPQGWAGVVRFFKDAAPRLRETGETPREPEARQWFKDILAAGWRAQEAAFRSEEDTTGWAAEAAGRRPSPASSAVAAPERGGVFIRHMPYQDAPDGLGAERLGSFAPEYDLESPPLRCPITQTIWSQEGSGYSQIVDLENLDDSLAYLPPGLSENPASPHYKDQMDLWAEGELRPAPMSRAGVEAIEESRKTVGG